MPAAALNLLAAQRPVSPRDAARLLDVAPDGLHDRTVRDLPGLLRKGDLLVFNDTKVIPARLLGTRPAGGKVEALLRKGADPNQLCTECKDELKDKPVVGMTLISGVKKAEGKEVWEGGKILDPENGRNYTLRMTPVEGGKKLEVRDSIGPFGRTQTWIRIQ